MTSGEEDHKSQLLFLVNREKSVLRSNNPQLMSLVASENRLLLNLL
jgi:hypothetical protein